MGQDHARKATLLILTLLMVGLMPLQANSLPTAEAGGLLYFVIQDDFERAFPSLTVEDFEGSTIADNLAEGFPGPLNSSTSNSYFSAGSIADGLSLNTIATTHPDANLFTAGGSYSTWGNTTKVVGTNYADEDLSIEFAGDGVNAVGMDLFYTIGSDTATIEIYDAENTLIDTLTQTINTTATFFGIYSSEPITKITIANSTQFELVDNVRFGTISSTLSFYSDKTEFETRFPGLPKEDFEESTVPPNTNVSFQAPLNKLTNGPVGFSEGDILEDIYIEPVVNTIPATALQLVGENSVLLNNPSKLVCHGAGGTDLRIRFLNSAATELEVDTYVMGMDLWQFAAWNAPPQDAMITVYDLAGMFLGSTIVQVRGGRESFIGLRSNQVILDITVQFLDSPPLPYECVDNIQYGSIPPAILTIYPNETAFRKARPTLPTEDFSESPVAEGASRMCNEPLNSMTDQAGCFAPGDILPGVSFQTENSLDPACPACIGLVGRRNIPPFVSSTPFLVMPSPSDPLEISFPGGDVHYVGLKMVIGLIKIYGVDDTLLGSVVNYPVVPEFTFRGFSSVIPIGRITLKGMPYVTEITFGPNFPWSMYMPGFNGVGR